MHSTCMNTNRSTLHVAKMLAFQSLASVTQKPVLCLEYTLKKTYTEGYHIILAQPFVHVNPL